MPQPLIRWQARRRITRERVGIVAGAIAGAVAVALLGWALILP